MKKMNPVIHFEMPYEDEKRLGKFYTNVFGWQTQVMGSQMGNYVLATTTKSDEKGPQKPGAINGGFFPKKDNPNPIPSVVISVENINESMNKVKLSGGKISGKIMDIPGVGRYVSFQDTEGNRVGMLQPAK